MQSTSDVDPVARAIVWTTVEDWAAVYYGGALHFSEASAIRYVADGHLEAIVAEHGRDLVWDLVAAYIEANPFVLDATPEERKSRQDARRRRASEIVATAGAALRMERLTEARRLLDEAELIDPVYEHRPGIGYDQLRSRIDRQAEVQ